MYKKLLLPIVLLLCTQKTLPSNIVIIHQYTYSTPLSLSLVRGYLPTFLEESKFYNDDDAYFALTEFIRFRPINKTAPGSPSINYALKYLSKELTRRIKRINNQIKNQYKFDYKSLARSIFYICMGAGLIRASYYYEESAFSLSFKLSGIATLPLSLIDLPNILDPNRDNDYLEKYKNLLKFIKKLQKHKYQRDSISWDLVEIFI